MEIIPFGQFGDVPGISLVGKLCTLNDFQKLRTHFNNIKIQSDYMIINFSRLTFTSSYGIGILFGISRKLNATGTELILYNPRDEVKAVLTLAGIDRRIEVAYSEEDLQQIITRTSNE